MNPDMRRSTAEILRAVAVAVSDGVLVVAGDGTILEFNVVAERIFGRSRADVIGQKMIDTVVPPTLRDAHRATIARYRTGNTPPTSGWRFRTLGQRADDSTIPIEVTLSMANWDESSAGQELILAFVRDRSVSENASHTSINKPTDQVAEELWKARDHLDTILELAPLVVFAVDRDGFIQVCAGGGLATIGFAPGELTGRNILSVYPDRKELSSDLRRALAGERFHSRFDTNDRVLETYYQPMYSDDGTLSAVLGVSIDITAQIVSERALRILAETDTVTGLSSRSHIEESLARLIVAGEPLALLLVDLDDFKDINDSHGHAIGDVVLHQVGSRLRQTVPAGSSLGRLGGDELVVGVRTNDMQEISQVADAILEAISAPMRIMVDTQQPIELDVSLTASIGIAVSPIDGDTMSSLLACADSAMYAAKRSGRATHRFYRADADRARRRLEVSTQLRSAITAGQLDVEYQPILDLAHGTIVGFEALARWNDTLLGPVSPDEFIPFAENSPLIDDLFELVLLRSLDAAVAWNAATLGTAAKPAPRTQGGELIAVSVNIAARQLRDVSLPNRIIRAAASVGLPSSCVALELTETALMDDSSRTRKVLGGLRDVGIRVMIDDYGVGYSNMARLSELSAAGILDSVKIDRTFVADLPSERAKTLLTMFVTMTDSLGVHAVAEGIESAEQLQTVRALGCRYGQGWHFSESMSADSAVRLVLGP